MLREIPRTFDRYGYSTSPEADKVRAVFSKTFNGEKNPITPITTGLYETDKYYIEVSEDIGPNIEPFGKMRGCTVLTKDGQKTDLSFGGPVSMKEIMEFLHKLEEDDD